MSPLRIIPLVLFSFIVLSFFNLSAEATPLFAMQSAIKCDTCHEMPDKSNPKWVEENFKLSERKCRLSCSVCHTNPSGGMLRNASGLYFGTQTLPSKTESKENLSSYLETLQTGKFVSFGGDLRFMTLYEEDRDNNPAFFPMQADVYMRANLLKHVTFMTQYGLQRGGNSSVREVFGLIENLPFNSYVKAGKFIPPYGHRLDDHTALIRKKLSFDHSLPGTYVTGVEIGTEPLVAFARAAVFNADATPATNSETTRRGVTGVLGWRGLWLHVGASYMDMINQESNSSSFTDRKAYGLFGSVRIPNVPILERLVWMFEVDKKIDTTTGNGSSTTEDAIITFDELDFLLFPGLNLKLRYEMYDPDASSSDEKVVRTVFGVDYFPYPYTELNLQYIINDEETNDVANNDFLLIVHFWF